MDALIGRAPLPNRLLVLIVSAFVFLLGVGTLPLIVEIVLAWVVGFIVYCSVKRPFSSFALQEDGRKRRSWEASRRFAGVLEEGGFVSDELDASDNRVFLDVEDEDSFVFGCHMPGFNEDRFVSWIENSGPVFSAEAVRVERVSSGVFRVSYASLSVLDELAEMDVPYASFTGEVY